MFALGSHSRYLFPVMHKAFYSIQDKANEFEIINFSCVISWNILPRSEFIFLRFAGQSLFLLFVCSN